MFFFFDSTATTEINTYRHTLALHDARPIYRAIRAMREGSEAIAPKVLIVNLALGNRRQPFHGRLSAWAKLLDRLAYQYGILFVISAGNIEAPFAVPAFATRTAFAEDRKSVV